MKSLIVVLTTSLIFISCKETGNAPETDTNGGVAVTEKVAINPKNLQTASFTIDGMTCAIGCAKTIEKKLSETQGVQEATVDFDKKEATVSYDSALQNPESLQKIVEASADGKTYKVSNSKKA